MAGIDGPLGAALYAMCKPFKWGIRRDCSVACVAFHHLHGIDPLERCADSYNTTLGAARILKRAGGYLKWCEATFDLPKTESTQAGDLALIESADAFGAALALCITPGEFASKTEAGMIITKAKVVGAWTWRF